MGGDILWTAPADSEQANVMNSYCEGGWWGGGMGGDMRVVCERHELLLSLTRARWPGE